VLNKVFLALVKFNALLNGPTKDSVASRYSIWHSYHHLYQALQVTRNAHDHDSYSYLITITIRRTRTSCIALYRRCR
jgi:hypothetical protein